VPWKARSVVNERMIFISRLQDGERMSELCREFGISRKTGYKLLARFDEHGPAGLYDQSRARHTVRHRVSEQLEQTLVEIRHTHPTWGARKLHAWLRARAPGVHLPAIGTISRVLKRQGLIQPRKRRSRSSVLPYGAKLRQSTAANELWCIDFKGQFRLGNGRLCYPLTVTDHHSRFLLGCEALDSTQGGPAKQALKQVFREYGIPQAIRSDNGPPFASNSIAGLSALSVWWLKLGITPERIEPGHPEQNGRHERMHLTLKQETTRPPGSNQLQQQERFDVFARIYNVERPHEAVGDRPPATLYSASDRLLPKDEPEPTYPLHDLAKRLNKNGCICFGSPRHVYAIGRALAHEPVGLRELEDGRWLVTFANLDLGYIDLRERRFEPMEAFDLSPLAS
jgi:transposase InsO family protein